MERQQIYLFISNNNDNNAYQWRDGLRSGGSDVAAVQKYVDFVVTFESADGQRGGGVESATCRSISIA